MSVLSYCKFLLEYIKLLLYCIWTIPATLLGLCVPHRLKSIKGEIILVTGGANGIGREICRELVKTELDLTVIIWDVDVASIEATVKELQAMNVKKVVGFEVDVSDRHRVKMSADQIRREIGDVTMLFNNAGVAGNFGVSGWTERPETIEKVLNVNMTSHCWTLQEFLPAMISKDRGHVIETCSGLGLVYVWGAAAYIASKHGVKAYTECIKEDLRHLPQKPKIHFTLVYPNFTSTNMMDQIQMRAGKYPFLLPKYSPEDVAKRAVKGVLQNEEHVYFPAIYCCAPLCIGMWPSEVFRKALDIIDMQYGAPKQKSDIHIV